jgi:hypothetical protein
MDSFMSSDPKIEDEIRECAKSLHLLRLRENEMNIAINELKLAWEVENADKLTALADTKRARVENENTLRQLILRAHAETKDKHFLAGDIRNEKEIEIVDAKKAFAWATEHKVCLALDTKAAMALVKAGTEIDGIVMTEVPKATIKTDLGKALGINS